VLRRGIEEQVEVIYRCLGLHERVVGSEMRPLHEELVGLFTRNFAKEIASLGLRVDILALKRQSLSMGSDPSSSTTALTRSKGSKKGESEYRDSSRKSSPFPFFSGAMDTRPALTHAHSHNSFASTASVTSPVTPNSATNTTTLSSSRNTLGRSSTVLPPNDTVHPGLPGGPGTLSRNLTSPQLTTPQASSVATPTYYSAAGFMVPGPPVGGVVERAGTITRTASSTNLSSFFGGSSKEKITGSTSDVMGGAGGLDGRRGSEGSVRAGIDGGRVAAGVTETGKTLSRSTSSASAGGGNVAVGVGSGGAPVLELEGLPNFERDSRGRFGSFSRLFEKK
ncbi:hypothetical protein HK097_007901, partial [Rhizophlyctis rosea]